MSANKNTTSRPRKRLQPRPESGFMSLAQVSVEFGLSQSYLYHLPASALPRYPVGQKWFYERAEVVAAIKGGRLMPVTARPNRRPGRPRKAPIATTAATNP